MATIDTNLQTVFSMCEVPQDQENIRIDPADNEMMGRLLRDVVIADTHLEIKFDEELPYSFKKVNDISTLMTKVESDIAEESFISWFHRVVETNNCFKFQGFLLMNFLGVQPPRIRARSVRRNGRRIQTMVTDLQKKELLLFLFAKKRLMEREMETQIASVIKQLFPYRSLGFVKTVLNSIQDLNTGPIEKLLLKDGEIAHIFKMCVMAMEDV